MNKSQKLNMKILRAKIKTKKLVEKHNQSWNGESPKVIKAGEKYGNSN